MTSERERPRGLYKWCLLLYGYAERLWLYAKIGYHWFIIKWCKSEIEYLDKRIAEAEKDLKS